MATAKTARYITLTELRHDGEDIAASETIELTAAQAEQLVELGAVEPAPAEPAAKARK